MALALARVLAAVWVISTTKSLRPEGLIGQTLRASPFEMSQESGCLEGDRFLFCP